jgi:hypothetical protein
MHLRCDKCKTEWRERESRRCPLCEYQRLQQIIDVMHEMSVGASRVDMAQIISDAYRMINGKRPLYGILESELDFVKSQQKKHK